MTLTSEFLDALSAWLTQNDIDLDDMTKLELVDRLVGITKRRLFDE